MRTRIMIRALLFIWISFLSGCVSLTPTLKFADIRTVPKGATVEAKITYLSEVNPNYREDQAYTYIGETPLIARWQYKERAGGIHYISVRISKPGCYPVERTYRAANAPDKIELELEKIR